MTTHIHPCLADTDCAYLYTCVSEMCAHKDFFPPSLSESLGMIVISVFSGFASLAGIGGGGIMVSIMTAFFNYTQKEAVLMIFVPVFGAALGNFLNLIRQVDPQNGQPIVNIRAAILACPIMVAGSIVGVMINKFLSAFFIVLVLVYFLMKSLVKFYNQAMKETTAERNRNNVEMTNLLLAHPEIPPVQYTDVILAAAGIVITVLTVFLVRGSKDKPSLIGMEYCGFLYWLISFGVLYVLWKYFELCYERFMEVKDEEVRKEYMISSFKAGLINGFGLGGGMFLIPMYISLKFSSIQSTGTSSFNILLSSFVAVAQIVILGLTSLNQAIWVGGITVIGCFCSSSYIFQYLKKRDRLSFIMWSLLFFAIFAMFNLTIKFMTSWGSRGFQVAELFAFQSLC